MMHMRGSFVYHKYDIQLNDTYLWYTIEPCMCIINIWHTTQAHMHMVLIPHSPCWLFVFNTVWFTVLFTSRHIPLVHISLTLFYFSVSLFCIYLISSDTL